MERRLTLAGRSPGTRIDSSPIEPSRADRLIADVQSGVVYIVVNFIGTRGKEGRRKISIAKRKQLAATLADKTPNTGRGGGHSGGKKQKRDVRTQTREKGRDFLPFPSLSFLLAQKYRHPFLPPPPPPLFRTIFTFQLYNALLASMSESSNLGKVIISRNNFCPHGVISLFLLWKDSLTRENDFVFFFKKLGFWLI